MYQGRSNSTATSTLTLSQTNVKITAGSKVECAAWVQIGKDTKGPAKARFDLFLDDTRCGTVEIDSTHRGGWYQVGTETVVQGHDHTAVLVVSADAKGQMGSEVHVGVDDVKMRWC